MGLQPGPQDTQRRVVIIVTNIFLDISAEVVDFKLS